MAVQDSMAKVVAALDWNGADVNYEPELGTLAELLRSRLGDGVLRWMLGTVRASLATLGDRIDDPLAPRAKFRVLSQHMLTNILLELAEEGSFPVEKRVIDREIVSDFVARDISLPVIASAFRHVQREWLARLIDATIVAGADAPHLMPDLVNSVTSTVDAWVVAMVDALVQERRRVAQTEQLRVRSTIEALISGAHLDVATTSILLRRPMNGWHTCCVIGALAGEVVDRQEVDAVEWFLSRSNGRSPVLRYENSSGKTYLWTTTENSQPSLSCTALGISAPHIAGVGEPHRGAEGFRRSFVEAGDALQLALRTEADGGLDYRDAALAITLIQDDERARWFVEYELGGLAGDSAELADMRNTLQAFFATRMRIAPAAERLFIHRNTLIRRLERIEKLIGHPLSERNAEIQAALSIAELYFPCPAERSPKTTKPPA